MLTRDDLLNHLCAAGIAAGETLIVHSSLKSIGPVRCGPATVVSALIDAVGPGGTMLMPTFSYPQPDGIFYVATTPSRTGAITEAFRTTPGVVRSHHPTHSVAAIGARAKEFTAAHEKTTGLGVGSPFHNAAIAGAKILMIGCDLRACSLVHVAESIERVPYLGKVWFEGRNRELTLIAPSGRSILFPPRDMAGCSTNFLAVQRELERTAELTRAKIGLADALIFSAAAALRVATALLEADASALLCDEPICPVCPKARAIIAKTIMHLS